MRGREAHTVFWGVSYLISFNGFYNSIFFGHLMKEQVGKLVEENLLSERGAEYILKKLESLYGEIGESL